MDWMDWSFRIIGTLIAAFIGTIYANYLNRRKEKISLALELKREFNNNEFSRHRRVAHRLIQDYPDKSFEELSNLDEERSLSIYILMRFYENLWITIANKKIDRKLADGLFGEIFIYWYYVSFKHDLVDSLNWTIGKKLKALNDRFERTLPNTEFETHKKRGLEKLALFKSKAADGQDSPQIEN